MFLVLGQPTPQGPFNYCVIRLAEKTPGQFVKGFVSEENGAVSQTLVSILHEFAHFEFGDGAQLALDLGPEMAFIISVIEMPRGNRSDYKPKEHHYEQEGCAANRLAVRP